jgi:hypothetical protein
MSINDGSHTLLATNIAIPGSLNPGQYRHPEHSKIYLIIHDKCRAYEGGMQLVVLTLYWTSLACTEWLVVWVWACKQGLLYFHILHTWIQELWLMQHCPGRLEIWSVIMFIAIPNSSAASSFSYNMVMKLLSCTVQCLPSAQLPSAAMIFPLKACLCNQELRSCIQLVSCLAA